MAAEQSGLPTEATTNDKKRKRAKKSVTIAQYSCRKPVWSYLHLRHIKATKNNIRLDETTVSLLLDTALSNFLGLHGRAILVDFMKLEDEDIWVRVPHQDQQAFVGALSTWASRDGDMLRVLGWSSWDANAYSQNAGQELFVD